MEQIYIQWDVHPDYPKKQKFYTEGGRREL